MEHGISISPRTAHSAVVLCDVCYQMLQVTAAAGGQLIFDFPVCIQVCSAKHSACALTLQLCWHKEKNRDIIACVHHSMPQELYWL